ncbi:sigma-70 family RNA polymerase sigma factor [Antrihabitans cavernicola]|uniref:Sigma-70 family RNA polymerase sigma factor n=1 Tax=Antrihabitans cavernicola TaxID=2495913 RepID=A0A5A7SA31_9NOCA|nr:sigma-70 family RNA polymerase sigma factor [Spelaeibacter cavernicola]KAA0021395.1 sigma-70 family RNA polymerase sigma factor [Spelaeibacter cavernicola]
MSGSFPDSSLADAFVEQRPRLVAVAHRILGSRVDAEDAVQEAWLRLARQDAATIDNLSGWLTTVVSRVCIDTLRSRKAKPEQPYDDDRVPEMIVTEDIDRMPEEGALLADSVGLALLVVLDSLSPAERLAFVLHDTFAVPFDEVAQIVGKSTDATKMLASRARRKVQGTQRPASELQRQRDVVDAFLSAARSGDFEALLEVLDPDVRWTSHTARGVVVRLGATQVAGRAKQGAHAKVSGRRVLVDGQPGLAAWGPTGKPLSVMACTVVDGKIVEIVSVTDPKRLATMDLPKV